MLSVTRDNEIVREQIGCLGFLQCPPSLLSGKEEEEEEGGVEEEGEGEEEEEREEKGEEEKEVGSANLVES